MENDVDPQGRARVQVSVPRVLGEGRLSWAEPCVPHAGPDQGFHTVPPRGAAVWVEFEGGDPDYPILAGGRWEANQAPARGLPTAKVWKSESVTITLSDLPGAEGLTVRVASPTAPLPLTLSMTSDGIELSVGASSIVLDGKQVAINKDALVVT
ncbi:phage baseplate assembly protein V [Actinomycetospora sp. NBRC 106375]|uniref:phage baseplate assembly protein V n=1 Tax=Actinomycetospora sp. NBRC 106375 TaxID=3032207 RepID=UPI0025579490|nr:phage baseplate assembly protein V [Actinomycetospora sp. NBRC 106375]